MEFEAEDHMLALISESPVNKEVIAGHGDDALSGNRTCHVHGLILLRDGCICSGSALRPRLRRESEFCGT